MQKVKIISGWSNPGGGTVAHIALTNLLNESGFDCTFYGPHDWHMDKCKGGKIQDANLGVHDYVISHFIHVKKGINVKKHFLYCHEKQLFPLKQMDLSQYDCIVFVSNKQKDWHSVNYPSVIIPPPVDKFDWTEPQQNFAGVVGSIDKNKQTHKSIQRALADGYEKVLLFGDVTDMPYFNAHVAPLVESGKAVLMGHEDSREALYGQVKEVYHSSLSETYGLVEAECRLSGIPFNGESNGQEVVDRKEILERWKKVLQ